MVCVSFGLAEDFHLKRLIQLIKVRFEDIVKIYLSYTKRRHHKDTKYILYMKLWISDSK